MELSKENLTKEERKALKAQTKANKNLAKLLHSRKNFDGVVNVLCVRFGHLYHRGYVEKLRNMVSRHLTIPYNFYCLTDDNHEIPGVLSIVQPHGGYKKGWWHKVHMFDPQLPISGRILYMDLDVIVHNNIDKLFLNYQNEFLGIRDFNRKFNHKWQNLNSSVMSWTKGDHAYLYSDFIKDKTTMQRMPGDQDYIWKKAKKDIRFWPDDWIQSYKWEIRSKEDLTVNHGKRKFREAKHDVQINPNCSISVFHGDPKPQDIQDKFVIDNWC
jgi:hypothetical protein